MEARLLKQNNLNGPEFMSIENDKLAVKWIDLGEGIWGKIDNNTKIVRNFNIPFISMDRLS